MNMEGWIFLGFFWTGLIVATVWSYWVLLGNTKETSGK